MGEHHMTMKGGKTMFLPSPMFVWLATDPPGQHTHLAETQIFPLINQT